MTDMTGEVESEYGRLMAEHEARKSAAIDVEHFQRTLAAFKAEFLSDGPEQFPRPFRLAPTKGNND